MNMQAFQVLDYPERLRKLLVSSVYYCPVALLPASVVLTHA